MSLVFSYDVLCCLQISSKQKKSKLLASTAPDSVLCYQVGLGSLNSVLLTSSLNPSFLQGGLLLDRTLKELRVSGWAVCFLCSTIIWKSYFICHLIVSLSYITECSSHFGYLLSLEIQIGRQRSGMSGNLPGPEVISLIGVSNIYRTQRKKCLSWTQSCH